MLVFLLLLSFQFVYFPTSKIYLTSLCSSDKWEGLNLFIFPVFYVYIFVQNFLGCIPAFFFNFQCLLIFYTDVTPIFWKDLRSDSSHRTSNALRTPKNLTKEYRSVEVIHKLMMDYYKFAILPFHALVGALTVSGSYTLTRHSKKMEVINIFIICNWIIVFVCWSLIIKFGGFYHSQCIKTIKSWKFFDFNKEDKLYMTKFTRSCRPMKIGDQIRFNFTNLTVLSFIKGVTRLYVRALLTFK